MLRNKNSDQTKVYSWKLSFLVVLFIQIIYPVNLKASENISVFGTVVEDISHEPISHANIFLTDGFSGTFSDRNGYFSLRELPAGKHELRVEHIGYKPYRKTLQLRPDSTLYITVELYPQAIEADSAVVIESRRNYISLSDIGQLRISRDILRDSPVLAEPDLFRTLRLYPGITTTNDYNMGLHIRGGNSDQNLILLDGMPIFNPYHLTGIFSTFDTEAIQLATVQKSNLDPAYGNRASGVVDINLRDGTAQKHTGTFNLSLLSSKVLLEGPHRWGTYLISFRRTYFDLLLNGLRAADLLPREAVFPYNFTDGIGKFVIKPTRRQRIEFTSYAGLDKFNLSALNNENDSKEIYLWSNYASGISYRNLLSPHVSIHAHGSWSRFYTEWLPADTSRSEKILNNLTGITSRIFGRLQHRFGTSRFGGEAQFLKYQLQTKGFSYQPLNIPATKPEEYSLFFDWEFSFIDDFSFYLGNRTTYFSQVNSTVSSPQLSLGYRNSQLLDIKINWEKSYQGMVTIGTEETMLSMFDAWVTIPEYLDPVNAEQLSLTLNWHMLPGINIQHSIFFKQFPNLVEYNTEKFDPDETDFINGSGKALGFELMLKKSTGLVHAELNYTFSRVRKTFGGLTYAPRYDKPHNLNAWLRYRHPSGRSLGVNFVYSTGTPFTRIIGYHRQHFISSIHGGPGEVPVYSERNAYRLPPYHRLDLNFSRFFSWKSREMEWYLSLINVYARMNVLGYSERNDRWIQLPPFITIGIRGKLW
jgi:hypothetical protein